MNTDLCIIFTFSIYSGFTYHGKIIVSGTVIVSVIFYTYEEPCGGNEIQDKCSTVVNELLETATEYS